MRRSQNEAVLSALVAGERLTPLDALHYFGCGRLGARVYELRRLGYPIRTELVAVETTHGYTAHVARYSMDKKR